MDRVATSMQSQTLLTQFMKTQRSMLDAQLQVSTGRKINEFADDPASISGLLAAKGADAQAADYSATATTVKARLDLQDTQINSLGEAASSLRQSFLTAIASGSAVGLDTDVQGALDQFKSVLNAKVDGQYIYGGTRQDVPPVTVSTVADLAALPAASNAFQNNQTRQSAKTDTSQTIIFGQLASDLGTQTFDMIKQLAAFNAGPNGPISGTLTQAQSDFLTGLANTAASAADSINQQLGENGTSFREASQAIDRHADTRNVLAGVISNIQDADMASAVDKLNQSQLAMQASAKTFASVQGLSLLNFLPTG